MRTKLLFDLGDTALISWDNEFQKFVDPQSEIEKVETSWNLVTQVGSSAVTKTIAFQVCLDE